MKKTILTNPKMVGVFAKFLGKKTLAPDDSGKINLSEDEKEKLTAQFGAKVVELLTKPQASTSGEGSDDDNSAELFDAATKHLSDTAVAEATATAARQLAQANTKIASLQGDIATLAATPEPLPSSEPVGTVAGKGNGFRANMALNHNRAAAEYLRSGVMAADPGETIDVADLQKEIGTYLSQGNNLPIIKGLYNGFTTSKFLRWIAAVTEFKASQSEAVSNVVQQFKAEWNAKGKAKFRPLKINNFRHKVNYAIIPAEVAESWLFHLYDESKTPSQMPLTKYIIDNILMPKILDDIEMLMIGKAKYVEDSTETSETMDGFETQLVEAKKLPGKKGINFWKENVNLLELNDEEVVEVIDDYVASIAPYYKARQMPLFMGDDVYLKYKRGYKKKWGTNSGTENTHFGKDRVDFSNSYFQVLDFLHGSPIIFSTPPDNFIGLRHKNPPQFIQKILEKEYEVRIVIEFWLGVGFLIGEAVWAIVPDGYDPGAAITSISEGAEGKWLPKETTSENDPTGDGEGA